LGLTSRVFYVNPLTSLSPR